MNPMQALDFLDNIVRQVSMPREGHVQAAVAVEAIRQALAPNTGSGEVGQSVNP